MCCYFDGWWRYTVVQHTLSHNLWRYFCSLQCDFHRVFTGTFLYHLFSFTRQPPLICCSTFVSPFLLSALIFRIHDKNAMHTHSSAGRAVCTTASSAFLFLRLIIDCCRIFGGSVLNRKQIGCVANGFIEECVRIQMHQFKKMASIRCIFVPFSHLLKPNHDAKATNYWSTLQELLLVLCAQFHMWMHGNHQFEHWFYGFLCRCFQADRTLSIGIDSVFERIWNISFIHLCLYFLPVA